MADASDNDDSLMKMMIKYYTLKYQNANRRNKFI